MIKIDQVRVRPLTVTSAEISWTLVPTDEPLSTARFTVLRSESPEGPYVDASGPMANVSSFVDKANLKAKHNTVAWRVRVDDVITGISTIYPNGNPTEAFKFHPDFNKEEQPGDFRPDFIALEIARRNNLLLRRFTGRLLAYCGVRTQGPRCPMCFDGLKRRSNSSACKICFGTTFEGGFYTPVPVFIDVNPSPNVMQVANFGKIEENQTAAFMANYPLVKPNDMIVEPTNRRWRAVQVNTVTKNRYIVQQFLQLQEIDRSDSEYLFDLSLDLLAPAEDFVGFFPKENSPKEVPTEGSGLL